MACQKICKQGRDDIVILKVNVQSPIPTSAYNLQLQVFRYCNLSLTYQKVRDKL